MSGGGRTWRVRTPEGVEFSFRIAGPMRRLLALAIDFMVVLAAWSLLSSLLRLFALVSLDVMAGVMAVGYFVLSSGYDIAWEWRMRGQTPGKRLLRLRVVDAGGLRLTFPQVVLRNLLRMVDALPFGYGVGGAAMFCNRSGQRLGDLAAGTLVVYEAVEQAPLPVDMATGGAGDGNATARGRFNSLRGHAVPVARLRQAVTPGEARLARDALARRDLLEPAARLALFARLADHFRTLGRLPPALTEGVPDEQLVRNVVAVLFGK
ncbi:putative membrane protein [Opitutaceae bacterium TAV1]|nr:putative membrane protein [Opitutaceae bacterium TAV1]